MTRATARRCHTPGPARATAAGCGTPCCAPFEQVLVKGAPGLLVRLRGEVDSVLAVRIEDGRISGLYAMRNPEKPARLGREATVSR